MEYKYWIMTFTGKKFYFENPKQNMIDIIDIAHALSLKCRFSGHCKSFYSVAEHSVRVAWKCPKHLKLKGLLHDAAEAYLPDVPRPIKQMMPQFKEWENRLEEVIFFKYDVLGLDDGEVKEIDSIMCLTEGRDLMLDVSDWLLAKQYKPYEDVYIKPWSSEYAFKMFMRYFLLYGGACRSLNT